MTRLLLSILVIVAAMTTIGAAQARDVCAKPVAVKGKPAIVQRDAERMAIAAWNARQGSGSPFAWDSPHTQRKALKCAASGGRFTCDASAIPCAPLSYEACQGAVAQQRPDNRDFCAGRAASGTTSTGSWISAGVGLSTCGPGYRLQVRPGPDICQIDARWTGR